MAHTEKGTRIKGWLKPEEEMSLVRTLHDQETGLLPIGSEDLIPTTVPGKERSAVDFSPKKPSSVRLYWLQKVALCPLGHHFWQRVPMMDDVIEMCVPRKHMTSED